MSGLKTNSAKDEILAATSVPPPDGDYMWDGSDEDDRPLSKEEMRSGMKRARSHPPTTRPKKQITIRLNPEIVEHFKTGGKGWQTRINDVLLEYVRKHRAA